MHLGNPRALTESVSDTLKLSKLGWVSKECCRIKFCETEVIANFANIFIAHICNIYFFVSLYFTFPCYSVIIRIRMSFIGQLCLHIQGICYSDRSSTVQQKDSNGTGHRQQNNNIQIYKMAKTQYSIQTVMCAV